MSPVYEVYTRQSRLDQLLLCWFRIDILEYNGATIQKSAFRLLTRLVALAHPSPVKLELRRTAPSHNPKRLRIVLIAQSRSKPGFR